MLHRPACESDLPAEMQVCCAAVMSGKDIASGESPRRAHNLAIKPGMQAESSPKKALSASTPPFTPLVLRTIDLHSIKSPAQDIETARDFSFPKFTHTQLESASSAPPTPTQRLNVSYQQAMRYSYEENRPSRKSTRQARQYRASRGRIFNPRQKAVSLSYSAAASLPSQQAANSNNQACTNNSTYSSNVYEHQDPHTEYSWAKYSTAAYQASQQAFDLNRQAFANNIDYPSNAYQCPNTYSDCNWASYYSGSNWASNPSVACAQQQSQLPHNYQAYTWASLNAFAYAQPQNQAAYNFTAPHWQSSSAPHQQFNSFTYNQPSAYSEAKHAAKPCNKFGQYSFAPHYHNGTWYHPQFYHPASQMSAYNTYSANQNAMPSALYLDQNWNYGTSYPQGNCWHQACSPAYAGYQV